MALPDTARLANIKDSWKKYFNDNLRDSVYVSFDDTLVQPKVQGRPTEKWIKVKIGGGSNAPISERVVEVFCCTRRDAEGFKVNQLRDTVMGLITDSADKFKRIPLYKSTTAASSTWTTIGKILIAREDIKDSGEMDGPDNTKIVTLTILTKHASGF